MGQTDATLAADLTTQLAKTPKPESYRSPAFLAQRQLATRRSHTS
jgi:hypothetical protein